MATTREVVNGDDDTNWQCMRGEPWKLICAWANFNEAKMGENDSYVRALESSTPSDVREAIAFALEARGL